MFKKGYKKKLVEKLKSYQEGALKTKYDVGFYNGLEVAIATIEERNPNIVFAEFEEEEKQEKPKGRTLYSGRIKKEGVI